MVERFSGWEPSEGPQNPPAMRAPSAAGVAGRRAVLPCRVASEMLSVVRDVRFPLIGPLLLSVVWAPLLGSACVQDPDADAINALDVCVQSADGSLCDDRQPCTINDVCLNHVCVGTRVADGRPCTDGNVCTGPDQCQAGVCVGAMLADGTACTDDDACTDLDVCQLGLCTPGGPKTCDDGNPCTLDTCVSPAGCVFSPRECAMSTDAAVDMSIDVRVDVRPDLPPDLAMDVAPQDAAEDAPDDAPDQGADAVSEGGPPDAAEPDTGALDTGIDVAVAPDAAPPDAGVDTPARADAGPDAAGDAGAGDLMPTAPDLRARGGGCQCGLARADSTISPASAWSPGTWLGVSVTLALVLTLGRGRPRRPRAHKKIGGPAHRR